MRQEDFLILILKGYFDGRENLDNHFYLECKEAEKKHIDYKKFFKWLINAFSLFREYQEELYNEEQAQHIRLVNLFDDNETNGIPNPCTFEELELQKPKKEVEDYNIHLFHLTKGRFRGTLTNNDLAYISNAIEKALVIVIADEVEKRKLDDEASVEKKNELISIFMEDKYFNCCLELMKEYRIIDEDERTILKDKGHGYLHAIIDAIKNNTNPKILKEDYTDEKLNNYFSNYLGKKVSQIKRGAYAIGYNEKKEDAKSKFRTCIK